MFSSIFEQERIYGDKISENLFLLGFEKGGWGGGVVWGMNVK
jgi:hypothetical protein